ncbi:tetratricopeptide repeat protein [Treponema phagedenis]|uniref:hypothetical protein n=1 Tax=Treponema phagedenis TaxID=162 RepID=UPI0001F63805|nr:hypothetical protein [Treponema phagedenis]EFW36774.1 hypothetical protein HMPREF9554_02737 [Treponema phagedenis F0421]TYT78593.1 hypothetical protein FS559_05380 [Treponema phagedenis]
MKLKQKFSFMVCLVLLLTATGFAQDIYNEFGQLKMGLYDLPESDRIKKIKDFQAKAEKDSALSEEEKLTISNLLILELANITKAEKERYLLFETQNKKNESYMEGKKLPALGKWFLVSTADVKSRRIAYLSGTVQINEAVGAKELYLQALKQDKKFSQGHLSYGLWLYFAPPIAGGGYDKALAEISKAVSYAKKEDEKFLALCFRSQVYFTLGQHEKTEADLQAAHAAFPSETFTELIREINKNGKVFFE